MEEKLACPIIASPCGKEATHYCNDNGVCCEASNGTYFCVCKMCYKGITCQRHDPLCLASGFEGAQVGLMTALDSILGVLLVFCLVAAVFLLIKYYKNRKNQCQADQEIKKSLLSSPEFGEDEVITKLMITDPEQHIWKEKVQLITHDSSKMKSSPWSDSFPGNLHETQWTERNIKTANQSKTIEA